MLSQDFAPGGARHILIVDDESGIRVSLTQLLKDAGFNVRQAGDARAALDLIEAHNDIDLLLTDVRMPGDMDGAELAFTVRSRWPRIGIIVFSAYFDPKVSRLPMGCGFIAKPFRYKELAELIAKHLGKSRAR